MRIIKVTPLKGEFVEMADSVYSDYQRFSSDNWEVRIGESWEPVYSCEKLEKFYQEWKLKANVIDNPSTRLES